MHLHFEEKNEPFPLENASKLTHEKFNKKIYEKFLVKNVNFDEFSRQNYSFIFLKKEALRRESVK